MIASGWMTRGHWDAVFTWADQAGESVPSTRNVKVLLHWVPLRLSVIWSVLEAPVKLIHENVRLGPVLPLMPVASGAPVVTQLQLLMTPVPTLLPSRFMLQLEKVC